MNLSYLFTSDRDFKASNVVAGMMLRMGNLLLFMVEQANVLMWTVQYSCQCTCNSPLLLFNVSDVGYCRHIARISISIYCYGTFLAIEEPIY